LKARGRMGEKRAQKRKDEWTGAKAVPNTPKCKKERVKEETLGERGREHAGPGKVAKGRVDVIIGHRPSWGQRLENKRPTSKHKGQRAKQRENKASDRGAAAETVGQRMVRAARVPAGNVKNPVRGPAEKRAEIGEQERGA